MRHTPKKNVFSTKSDLHDPKIKKILWENVHRIKVSIIFILLTASGFAQKIYILTDLEGISGIYRWKQAQTKDSPLYNQACEFFMEDLSAVIHGLKDGGATEIIVLDGHGPQCILPELMEKGVKYITGKPKPRPLYGMDESFDGLVQLGAHSMKGTPNGVLNHTQYREGKYRIYYNGIESGEIAMASIMAGYFGVPTVMVTGDMATCREAHQFLGNEVTTVAVKEGISEEAAILYPFEETRKALYEGAKQAVTSLSKCKTYKIKIPFTVRLEYINPQDGEELKYKECTYPDGSHAYDILFEISQ